MGKLHTIGKTIITVYANDHLPPHFHIVHPDFEALIVIETFAVYAGTLKGSAGKVALKWATENVQAVKAEWTRVNHGGRCDKPGKRGKMHTELPRIAAVTLDSPSTLRVRWRGKRVADTVNLSGWIATGGDILAPLRDPSVFSRAAMMNYGAAITWDDGEGDLAIDALHLSKLAQEQKPFSNGELRLWQTAVQLSNAECADLVGVRLSTWNSYRADAKVPHLVAITLRAALRDPLLMQAHLRPRVPGRPRKSDSESKRSARNR